MVAILLFILLSVFLHCHLHIYFFVGCRWSLCFKGFLFLQLVKVGPAVYLVALPVGAGRFLLIVDTDKFLELLHV